MVLLSHFLDSGSDSNHNVSVPFVILVNFLSLTAFMRKFDIFFPHKHFPRMTLFKPTFSALASGAAESPASVIAQIAEQLVGAFR